MRKTSRRIVLWIVTCLCLTASITVVAQEDSIVLDPNSGDYIITYRSFATGTGQVRVVWVPSTKIEPAIKWNTKVSPRPGVLTYRYKFKNSKTSRQDLEGGRLVASNVVADSQMAPTRWDGTVVPDRINGQGFLVGWSFDVGEKETGGIKPGATQGGFGFESTDLPGVGPIELWGSVPAGQSFPDEGPNELSSIRNQFVALEMNNFVSSNTAVPRISVPNLFDASSVLSGIQTHMDTDLINMKLIDPAFAYQLDRGLQAAIDATKLGQSKAVLQNIQELRKLLNKEHDDVCKEGEDDFDRDDDMKDNGKKTKNPLIDCLAARVLDFDLGYVEKRLKD